MTVGISAIAEHDDDPHAFVAADRMVTIGQQSGVEYEDSGSKIEPFIHNDDLVAVAVGAGTSTYIDEILETLHGYIAGANDEPKTARQAMEYCQLAYQETLRTTINNRVFAPLGYHINDLKDEETNIPAQVQQSVVEQAASIREEASKNVQILVTAVGVGGTGIYLVHGSDCINYSKTGYSIIGSGAESARLTFTRRQYDKGTTKHDGLFTTLEAKKQAEERQGVGQRLDMAILSQEGIRTIGGEEERNLREMLTEIEHAEQQAREKVMGEWEIKI